MILLIASSRKTRNSQSLESHNQNPTYGKGNVEDELILMPYSTKDTVAEEIETYARFLSLQEPKKS